MISMALIRTTRVMLQQEAVVVASLALGEDVVEAVVVVNSLISATSSEDSQVEAVVVNSSKAVASISISICSIQLALCPPSFGNRVISVNKYIMVLFVIYIDI